VPAAVRTPPSPVAVEAEVTASPEGPVVAYKVDSEVIHRELLVEHKACPTCGHTLERQQPFSR
jgi:hypothetical protein